MQLISVILGLAWAVVVHGHFVLQSPPNIGFDDDKENTAPCGSFDATNRTVVTQYPVGGFPLNILSTDNSINLTVRVAPAPAAGTTAKNLKFTKILQYKVVGTGTFCLPSVPVTASLAGQDSVMQVIGKSSDGTLYQCAAVRFVPGSSTKSATGDCTNSTGITISQVPATTNKTVTFFRA